MLRWFLTTGALNFLLLMILAVFSAVIWIDMVLPSAFTGILDELIYGVLVGFMAWLLKKQRTFLMEKKNEEMA